jgi:glyoxylase-like metal-dependent hydrolase (beta-lactamase superfamily II)
MTATVHVLTTGYVGDKVASTVTLIRDGAAQIVVDPGMVADRELILAPLRAAGVAAEAVTDVVDWDDRDADGFQVSEHVRLMRTPGHTAEDISTLVTTDEGLTVLTHLWWSAEGPAVDPFATDSDLLDEYRNKVLELAPVRIVPAHGEPFTPSPETPR